jgi:DNA-binding SARP family transcriptional activator
MAEAPIRVSLAGRIQLEGPAGVLDERALGGRQGRVAFAVLTGARHRPVPKQELAEALWPGDLPASWQAALRGVVTKVRSALTAVGLEGGTVIRAAFGCYQLILPGDVRVDLEAAAEAAEAAEVALAVGNPAEARTLAETAAAVVRQPFLPGEEGPFPDRVRRQLEALYLRALDALGRADLATEEVGAAIGAAEAALTIEPFRESAHRLLMEAYAASGSRGEALRAYERCRVLLADELGVRPSAETEAAYVALLQDRAPVAASIRAPVKSPPPVPRAPPLPDLPDSPFVGREREMAELTTALATAGAGRRQVVLVSGDMGVGKTRLAFEAGWAAQRGGATVLYGAATNGGVLPYEPLLEALSHYVGTCSTPQLAAVLAEPAAALLRLLPEAAVRLPDARPPGSSDPDTDRALVFTAWTAFLRRLAGDAPVVVILDDLHWAAAPALLLLDHIVHHLADAPLLVVATYRAEDETPELSDTLAELVRQDGVRRVHLGGLEEKAVAELVAASGTDPERALTRLLMSRTAGNAFFIRELLSHISADGPPMAVPDSVHELVVQRLRTLRPSTAKLLGLAAVAGEEFDVAVLEQVSSAADRDTLLDDLDEACGARVVEEVAAGRYRFRLSLVRDVVYEDLGATRRARLHQRVAEAIEAVGSGSTLPGVAVLARHLVAVGPLGDPSKAFDHSLTAGDAYLRATAYERAAQFYAGALQLLDRGRNDPVRRCEALIRLGDAQRRAGKARHRQTLLDAARLARELGDHDRLARAALANSRLWSVLTEVDHDRVSVLEAALAANPDPSPTRARLLALLAVELTFSPADTERRRQLSAEALALARDLGDDDTLAQVLVARCGAVWDPDSLADRRERIAEAAGLAAVGSDPFARIMVGLRRWDLGMEAADRGDADAGLADAGRLAEAIARPALRWQVRVRQTTRAVILGRLGEAAELLRDAHELGLVSGQPDAEMIFVAQLYFLRREQGRLGEMVDLIGGASVGHPIPGWRAALAAIYQEVGRLDEARRTLERYMAEEYGALAFDQGWLLLTTVLAHVSSGLDHAPSAAVLYGHLLPYRGQVAIRPPGGTGSVDRHLGRLAVTLGRFEDAARHFRRASAIYTRLGAQGWLARTQVGSARLLLRRGRAGDRRRAAELLAEAEATAARLGLRGVEREARALSDGSD